MGNSLVKLSDYVINFLVEKNVKHIFMLPGGGAMHLVDSLGKNKSVEYICCLHEQAVAVAAQSYAMSSDYNLGVGLVTTGPGGTNTITGVSAAWIDSVPCLFISGQVKRADLMTGLGIRQMGIQEVDIVSMVKSITKYAVTITEPNDIKYHLEKAVYLATTGRPGPVWLDIPLDVQGSMIDVEKLKSFNPNELNLSTTSNSSLEKNIDELIALIKNAQRPVIVAGDGIKIARAKKEFLQLIEQLQIPVIATWKAMDLLEENHPLYVGRSGTLGERTANFTLQNSDLVIGIGSKMDFSQTGFNTKTFARAAQKVVLDIDENEINKLQFVVDVKIVSDAKLFIQKFLEKLKSISTPKNADWNNTIKNWRKKYPVILPEYCVNNGLINPYYLIEVLSQEATTDDIINPCCSGTAAEYNFQAFKIKANQKFVTNHGLGPMGFEIPSAIGSCIANNKKRTIVVAGDGGIQLNIQELETLRRLNLPIKIFIMNNNGYSSIRTMQETHFNNNFVANDAASGLSIPDMISIAEAYKIKAIKISDAKDLKKLVKEALAYNGPVVCDVMVIPGFKVSPRVTAQRKDDGTMVSKPIEDMWPFLDREELKQNMFIPLVEE